MKSYSTAWTLAAATKKLNNKCVSLCAHCALSSGGLADLS